MDKRRFLPSIGLDFHRCELHAISPSKFRLIFVINGESVRGKQVELRGLEGFGSKLGRRIDGASALSVVSPAGAWVEYGV